MTITYEQLLTRVIDDGIAAAKQSYAELPDAHWTLNLQRRNKLTGALAGFEACRGKPPEALVNLYKNAELEADQRRRNFATSGDLDSGGYWQWRCHAAEIEWVCSVISVALQLQDFPPLLPHQPTARAALKYAEIVGVYSAAPSTTERQNQ